MEIGILEADASSVLFVVGQMVMFSVDVVSIVQG